MSSGSTSATCAPISGVPPTLNLILPVVVGDHGPERHLAARAGRGRDRHERRDALRDRLASPTRTRRSSRRAARRRRSTWPCPSRSRRRARRARRSPTPRRARRPRRRARCRGSGAPGRRRPRRSRCSSARSARPAAATPGSVTSSGRVTPSSRRRSPSRAIAPGPCTSRVGHLDGTDRVDLDGHAAPLSGCRRRSSARCRQRSVPSRSLNVKIWKPPTFGRCRPRLSSSPWTSGLGVEVAVRQASRRRIESPTPIRSETRRSFVRGNRSGKPDVDRERRASLPHCSDPRRGHLRVEADLADDVRRELLLLEHRLDRRVVGDERVALGVAGDPDLAERAVRARPAPGAAGAIRRTRRRAPRRRRPSRARRSLRPRAGARRARRDGRGHGRGVRRGAARRRSRARRSARRARASARAPSSATS